MTGRRDASDDAFTLRRWPVIPVKTPPGQVTSEAAADAATPMPSTSPRRSMLRPAGLGAAVTVVYRVAQTAARRLGWDLVSACQGGDLHAGWPLQCSSITDLSMKEKNL